MNRFCFIMLATLLGCPTLIADVQIRRGETRSLFSYINIHDSPMQWIEVGHEKYRNLRICNVVPGEDSYVRQIHGAKMILFVTYGKEGANGRGLVRIGSIEDGTVISVSPRETNLDSVLSGFGVSCYWDPKDRVIKVISQRVNDRVYDFTINLETRILIEERRFGDDVDRLEIRFDDDTAP